MLTRKDHLSVVFCRSIVLFLCMCLTTGCTTFKPMVTTDSQAILSQIKLGDEVRLTTRDGKALQFTLREATDKQLVGENERVNLSDITDIERREFSTGKTVGLIGGIIGVVLIIVIISAASNSKGSAAGGWNL